MVRRQISIYFFSLLSVIVLCMSLADQLTLLEVASGLKMATTHAFFTFMTSELDSSLTSVSRAELTKLIYVNAGVNIMESVFVVMARFPSNEATAPALQFASNDTWHVMVQDAVLLVAYTLDNYLKTNSSEALNTTHMALLMRNVSYDSHLGRITISSEGYVPSDYHIFDYDIQKGFNGASIFLQAVGEYNWTFNVTKNILWPGGITLEKDICFKKDSSCALVLQAGK